MSKIEVDQVTQQSGTTLTVGGGACKTAVVDATTVTLGRCGGTVSLASGATQSGFGRSGSVNWDTTPKTSTFAPVSGNGYFINSGSSLTANLPAGSAGDIVAFSDYARNFATYTFTVNPNGSEKIGGVAQSTTLTTSGQAATFVYVDSTKGWVNVQNADSTLTGLTPFINASVSGSCNTLVDDGDYKVATFVNPGTFCVGSISSTPSNNLVSYMVIGGGGGGGAACAGGGGGAGGYRELVSPTSPYTGSPLNGYPEVDNRITVSATAYAVAVGGGGPGGPLNSTCSGTVGVNSSVLGVTAAGGGYGGGNCATGGDGGSGGGGAHYQQAGGSGNTPSTTPAQGTDGGQSYPAPIGDDAGGGGGGALTAGGGNPGSPCNGYGGPGTTSSINGTPTARAGGGGGGSRNSPGSLPGGGPFPGGTGGGGNGGGGPGYPRPTCAASGSNGTAQTGSGGGGGGRHAPGGSNRGAGGNGGGGIVVIRYKFQ